MSSTNGTLTRTKAPEGMEGMSTEQLQLLSSVMTARLDLATRLGQSFSGKRDIYEALGYKKELDAPDFIQQWKRQDIARAVVDRPVKSTWQGNVYVSESTEEDETELEKEYKKLDKKLGLKTMFMRLDRLSQLGRYAVLLLGFDDSSQETWSQPVTEGERKLLYLKVVSQKNAEISKWEQDPSNERYGRPRLYNIKLTNPGVVDKVSGLNVHHSRVLHITPDLLEDDIEGVPIIETVFNRLKDLEKLIGGSAEMFWRGARPGYAGSAQEGYKIGQDAKTDLKEQIEEYEHDLRRVLVSEGVDLKSLAQQIADPKGHAQVQYQMISAVSGIPLRILIGSERGELASSQDDTHYKEFLEARRLETAEPGILRPFVDKMIYCGVLPEPLDEEIGYDVAWSDLFTMDDKDKSSIGKERTDALRAYQDSGLEYSVPFEVYLRYILRLEEEDINQILEQREAQMKEMEQEEAALEREYAIGEEEQQDDDATEQDDADEP